MRPSERIVALCADAYQSELELSEVFALDMTHEQLQSKARYLAIVRYLDEQAAETEHAENSAYHERQERLERE